MGYIKEKELTHDDVIALIDEHLQREVSSEEGEPDGEEEVVEEGTTTESSDNSTPNDEVSENDEIEKFSSSLKKKMEELDTYVVEKKKEIDKIVKQIKRKKPPSGEISGEATSPDKLLRRESYEVDV